MMQHYSPYKPPQSPDSVTATTPVYTSLRLKHLHELFNFMQTILETSLQ